jgi:hypothetical protein
VLTLRRRSLCNGHRWDSHCTAAVGNMCSCSPLPAQIYDTRGTSCEAAASMQAWSDSVCGMKDALCPMACWAVTGWLVRVDGACAVDGMPPAQLCTHNASMTAHVLPVRGADPATARLSLCVVGACMH